MAKKYLFVDFGPLVLRYLLGYDGVHIFNSLRLEMKTPARVALRGAVGFFSWSVLR